MRRLALVAAVLAVACSSDKDPGPQPDTVPPGVPVIVAPLDGAYLDATDVASGSVVVSGTAEGGATVAVEVNGAVAAGGAVAAADGAWSLAVPAASGAYTVRARAADAAGNASTWCAPRSFTVDRAPFAGPILPGGPWEQPVTSWGQTVPVTGLDASGLGELFPGQANSWSLDRDFSLAAGFGLQYANGLVLYTGTPTAVTHAGLLGDLLAGAFTAFPGDQTAWEATFLDPIFTVGDGVRNAAASDGLSMGLPPISGSASAYLNGTAFSQLGGYLLELAPAETYTFGWTHQAVLRAGNLDGADVAPYAPWYQVVLREPDAAAAIIGEPLFTSSTDVARATVSVQRSGLPPYAVLSFELRSAAPGYAQIDDLTLSSTSGPIALRNPGFEDALDGWVAGASGGDAQNVRSGARDVGLAGSALRVTRTFYAPPGAAWGRMVDVFENPGAADVSTTAIYATLLGGQAPLAAVTQGGQAVIGWDRDATVRDVGIAFGAGTAYAAPGDPFVFVLHDLTVPAGGKVALVHFVVQLGETAGGATAAVPPQGSDDACAAILGDFRRPGVDAYRAYLEPGLLPLVQNL